MENEIAKIKKAANAYIRANRWIAKYNVQFMLRDENGIPIPETFTTREEGVSWMEKELERLDIFKDHGIDRYKIVEKDITSDGPSYLLFEASVRGIRVCWALEKVTEQNFRDMQKLYFREARKRLIHWSAS